MKYPDAEYLKYLNNLPQNRRFYNASIAFPERTLKALSTRLCDVSQNYGVNIKTRVVDDQLHVMRIGLRTYTGAPIVPSGHKIAKLRAARA